MNPNTNAHELHALDDQPSLTPVLGVGSGFQQLVLLQAEDSMETESRMVHDELSVNELMSTEMVCLPPVIRISALAATLRRFSHGGFPISSEAECPVRATKSPIPIDGLITRSELLKLLQMRIGFITKVISLAPVD